MNQEQLEEFLDGKSSVVLPDAQLLRGDSAKDFHGAFTVRLIELSIEATFASSNPKGFFEALHLGTFAPGKLISDETMYSVAGIHLSIASNKAEAIVEQNLTYALSFALSFVPDWVCRVEAMANEEEATVTFRSSRSALVRSFPPLQFQQKENAAAVWQVVERFVAYAESANSEAAEGLLRAVDSVLRASQSSLEAEALTLSVNIEMLLDAVFSKSAPKERAEDINAAISVVESLSIKESIRTRIVGFLRSTMTNSRPTDVLKDLGISHSHPRLVKAWQKLRNASAHGAFYRFNDLQDLLDIKFRVQMLFNLLILYRIGYTGAYTDYSNEGWPAAELPDFSAALIEYEKTT